MSSRRLRFARARGVSCGDDLRAFFLPKIYEGTKSKIKTLNKTLNKSDALVFFSHSHPPHKTSRRRLVRKKEDGGTRTKSRRRAKFVELHPFSRYAFCFFFSFVRFAFLGATLFSRVLLKDVCIRVVVAF